jgi:predicted TIM-barrel fold metal-dependent hydrolase
MYLRCFIFALLFASNIFVFAQKGKETPLPIIDVHMHCYNKDPRFESLVPNPISGRTLTATNEKAHMLETIAEMKKYNIVKGMVSNYYDAALRWKAADPNRFMVGYAFDDPSTVDLDFLRREHKAGRFEVIGELGAQYQGIAPNDPRLEPIFALAEELDIPVAYHIHPGPFGAVYSGEPLMRQKINSPVLLEDVIIKHPKLRIYVMHAGYPRIDEMINMLYAYPQLYVDIGVIDWTLPREEFHGYLRRLVQAGYGERIMFGSDHMVWTDAIGMSIENINAAKFLTDKQKRDIFYNNAVRFFRLDKKDKTSARK